MSKKKTIWIDKYLRDSPYGIQEVRGHERGLPGPRHPREVKMGKRGTNWEHVTQIRKTIKNRIAKLVKLGADKKIVESRIKLKEPKLVRPDYWMGRPGGGRSFEIFRDKDFDPDSSAAKKLDEWEKNATRILDDVEEAWKE